ncbi:helix-turn-helix domain-containing protein [Paenibacillus sp. HWE-109]|uniref:helix-turn-helix domain-containing protein n=1 Tax=Paenibacillus sp. HWE-109 TaxID=1306526 RepID=UPI003080B3F6
MILELAAQLQLNCNIGKVTCEKNWKWDTRHQPLIDYDLWYTWSGAGTMNLHNHTYEIRKGSCFLFRPGDRTLAEHNPQQPLTVTFIHFSLPMAMASELPVYYHVVRDTYLFETYLNHFVETMIPPASEDDSEAKLLLTLLLKQLRREEISTQQPMIDRPNSVIRTIAHQIKQSPGTLHTVEALAEQAQLSPRYFALKFKQVMGITFDQYLIRMRIDRAEHLLRYNGMNVTEVAEALGYNDLSFFSRQFKQIRGKTPSQMMKEAGRIL